uniref:hypothetical protein n=1 Tax=Paracoccus sp. T5 TaxID=3402161 RepID=UPI003AEA56B1
MRNPERSFFAWREDKVVVKIWALLSINVVFLILLHLLVLFMASGEGTKLPYRVSSFFDLGNDGSLPELFNYGMLFLAAVLLMAVSFETGSRVAALFGVLMVFAWIDDSAQYHERMGRVIAYGLDMPSAFGLRAVDFGELIAWSLILVILGVMAIWARRNVTPGDGKVLLLMLPPLFTLLVCGVAFDMINIIIDGPIANVVLTAMEDGGEMLAIAWAAAVSLYILRNVNVLFGKHVLRSPVM